MLSNLLNQAIDRLDHEEVQSLLDRGANPYFPADDGRTPVQAWLNSQRLGNPYAERMGQALFSVSPISQAEEAELTRIAQQQVANVGESQGMAAQGQRMGFNYSRSYMPPQTQASSRACWAIVYQAMDRVYDVAPQVSAKEFATHYAIGAAKARLLMARDPSTGGILLKDNGGAPVLPDMKEVMSLQATIEKGLNNQAITVSPRGELRQQYDVESGGYLSMDGNLKPMPKIPTAERDTYDWDIDKNGLFVELVPPSYWLEKTLETRLDEVLRRKNWERAQELVNAGADIHRLPLDYTTRRLREMTTIADMEKMFSLGFNPTRLIPGPAISPLRPSWEVAGSQEQFDALLTRSKQIIADIEKSNPKLAKELLGDLENIQPTSYKIQQYWQNSSHYVDNRPLGAKVGEWVGSKIRESVSTTVQTVSDWRSSRRNPVAEQAPSPPTSAPKGTQPK